MRYKDTRKKNKPWEQKHSKMLKPHAHHAHAPVSGHLVAVIARAGPRHARSEPRPLPHGHAPARVSRPGPAPGLVSHRLAISVQARTPSRPHHRPFPRLPRGLCADLTSDPPPPPGSVAPFRAPFLSDAERRTGSGRRSAEREFRSFDPKPAFPSSASYRARGRRGPPRPRGLPSPLSAAVAVGAGAALAVKRLPAAHVDSPPASVSS